MGIGVSPSTAPRRNRTSSPGCLALMSSRDCGAKRESALTISPTYGVGSVDGMLRSYRVSALVTSHSISSCRRLAGAVFFATIIVPCSRDIGATGSASYLQRVKRAVHDVRAPDAVTGAASATRPTPRLPAAPVTNRRDGAHTCRTHAAVVVSNRRHRKCSRFHGPEESVSPWVRPISQMGHERRIRIVCNNSAWPPIADV
jgi:hypothetical protein